MISKSLQISKRIYLIVSASFILWGCYFIFKSSAVSIDGNRYFCLFDDAMISMRYAWNFAHGIGLVWNSGEAIQGYTNLLMTLFMSVFAHFFDKSTAVLCIQLSGIFFILAIAYVTSKITYIIYADANKNTRLLASFLSYLATILYYPLVYWSIMGMETGLLTLLVVTGVLFAFIYLKTKQTRALYIVAVSLGLAFWTRNDSLIFSLIIWAYVLYELVIQGKKLEIIALLPPIILYGLFALSLLSFQYFYYGDIVPNTFVLKLSGISLSERILNGLGFITPFFSEIGCIIFPAIFSLFVLFRKDKFFLLALVFSSMFYQIYTGGDPWNYWRMMSPTIPLLIAVFVASISKMLADRPSKFAAIKITSSTLIAMFLTNGRFLGEIIFRDKAYTVAENEKNINTAIALNELTEGTASVGVFWAGSIPYYTEKRAIDFLGKSDKRIAQLPPDRSGSIAWLGMQSVPGHNKYDLDYSIKTLKPIYVQGFIWGRQDLSDWSEKYYVEVHYKGVKLFLLRDSPLVSWNKINPT